MKKTMAVLSLVFAGASAYGDGESSKALIDSISAHVEKVRELVPLMDKAEKNLGVKILCTSPGYVPSTSDLDICTNYVKHFANLNLNVNLKANGINTIVFMNRGVPSGIYWKEALISFNISVDSRERIAALITRANDGRGSDVLLEATYLNSDLSFANRRTGGREITIK